MVAKPEALIVALAGTDDSQVAVELTSSVELSVKVAVAVNCWVRPRATLGALGVTAMLAITAAVTVKTSFGEVTLDFAAVMLVVPTVKEVASPVALTVATAVLLDTHVAVDETSEVVESVKVAVATYCCVKPLATVEGLGVRAILAMTATVTVKVTFVAVIAPTEAPMELVPVVSVVASPLELIVATVPVPLVHVASAV